MNKDLMKYSNEFFQLKKEINKINEELVVILNKLEKDFNFNPYENNNDEIKKLWDDISNTRNYNIYE